MVRSLKSVVSRIGIGVAVGALVLGVAAAGGVAGATSKAVPGGNASGGPLAKEGQKQALVGAKGTGLTRGITSTTISVGCVYTSADYAGYISGIQAAFHVANVKGIDGRKITLVPCKDDTGGVQSNVSEVEQLVQQNQVFAVLSLTEYILSGSTNFLNAQQVPYYGWGFNPGFCGARWGFGWNGCLSPVLLPTSNPLHNVDEGNLAAAIIKTERPAGQQGALRRAGGELAFGNQRQPGLRHVVHCARGQGRLQRGQLPVDRHRHRLHALRPGDPGRQAQHRLHLDALRRYRRRGFGAEGGGVQGDHDGLRHLLAGSSGLLTAQLASALQGEYINTRTVPQEQSTSPYVQQELAALKAQRSAALPHPGGVDRLRRGHRIGGAAPGRGQGPEHQDVRRGRQRGQVHQLHAIPAQGLGELLWPAAHFLPADCAAIVKVAGVNYNVVNPYKCYTSYLIKG